MKLVYLQDDLLAADEQPEPLYLSRKSAHTYDTHVRGLRADSASRAPIPSETGATRNGELGAVHVRRKATQ